jgi:outer membrane lipoprotein carrier protein
MKHFALTALALLLSLPALPAHAAAKAVPDPLAPGLSGNQRLQALVERVKLEQAHLKTMEARFVQQQESSMLAAPEESTGVFSFAAPDKVRWEYESPNPISVLVKGEEMTTWYHDLKRAETLKIGRYSSQVFKYLGASGSLQTLLDYFVVKLKLPEKAGESYRMELVPKYPRVAKRLRSMTLWIDDEIFFPERLRYVEADGDVTEYQFSGFKRNAKIPEDRFVLKLPKDVQSRVIDVSREDSATPKARP